VGRGDVEQPTTKSVVSRVIIACSSIERPSFHVGERVYEQVQV